MTEPTTGANAPGMAPPGTAPPGTAPPSTAPPATSPSQPVPIAGDAYSDFIKDQLKEERDRKSSIEQRGIAVISTSGVLVSLLFGLAAVLTTSKQFVLSGQAKVLLVLSLPFFLFAALAGIGTNIPTEKYYEPTADTLRKRLDPKWWDKSARLGNRATARTRIDILEKSRDQNDIKAKRLLRAMQAEVAGVCLVALAVVVIFVGPVTLPVRLPLTLPVTLPRVEHGKTWIECHGGHAGGFCYSVSSPP